MGWIMVSLMGWLMVSLMGCENGLVMRCWLAMLLLLLGMLRTLWSAHCQAGSRRRSMHGLLSNRR